MTVEIPTWFVPLAKVEYRAEMRQVLNEPLRLGSLVLPSPYPAFFSMLELVESPYYADPLTCPPRELARALYLLTARRDGMEHLDDDEKATGFLLRFGKVITEHLEEIVAWTHIVPFGGYEMIPAGKLKPPLRGPWLFDAEYLSGVGLILAESTGKNLVDCLWEESICLAGFLAVQKARAAGVEHVERPPDLAELSRIRRESLARAARGEKQPWEMDHETTN